VSRSARLPKDGLAQSIFAERLPDYVDLVVPQEPRSQQEAEFLGYVRHGLNELAEGFGCVLCEVTANYGNQGYRFMMVDRDRNPFYFGVSYDEMIALGETLGERGMVQRILALCVERCKAEMGKRHAS
jgi:hypothetical protein